MQKRSSSVHYLLVNLLKQVSLDPLKVPSHKKNNHCFTRNRSFNLCYYAFVFRCVALAINTVVILECGDSNSKSLVVSGRCLTLSYDHCEGQGTGFFRRQSCWHGTWCWIFPALSWPHANGHFVWGYVEGRVYDPPRAENLQDLRQRIVEAFDAIPRCMIMSAMQDMDRRARLCIELGGAQVEGRSACQWKADKKKQVRCK